MVSRTGRGIVEVSGSQWAARWQLQRLPSRPSPTFGSTTLAAARASEKQHVRALFDEMDTNRDGLVSLTQRESARSGREEQLAGACW